MLADQLENHIEKFVENYVEKRGHFLGSNLQFSSHVTEEEKQKFVERFERFRDDVNPRLTAEIERITLLFIDYLKRKGFVGEKFKPWIIHQYLYQQTHDVVNEILNDTCPRYGYDFDTEFYRRIKENLLNEFRQNLEENIYYFIERTSTDTPFSPLTEQQKITYLEGTEFSGYIDPNTFEAFQLAKGSPTLVHGRRLGESENLVFFHTHPQGDAMPSDGDLKVGERQIIISLSGSLLLESGKTKKEIQNEILKNISILFPNVFSEVSKKDSNYFNTHLNRLKQILNDYKVTFIPKTIDDIKFLDWPETGFFGKEEQEIVKEWMSREYASANPLQRRGVQGGGIQKPITEFQNRGWLPPERRDIAGETLSEEEAEELEKLREEIRGLRKEEEKEDEGGKKRYPSPLQDGMDVVPRTSDNLNYGKDFGGRRIHLSEKSDDIRVPQFGRPQEILPLRKEETYSIEESDFNRSTRERRGYVNIEEWDACKLKEQFEKDQNEPLAWNEDRLERLRQQTGVDSYPQIWFDSKGKLDILDGRHRIAIACERGQKITVAVKYYEELAEKSRLVFDLSPMEYDELLAELQQLEPEEAIMVLEELKQRQRKIKPPLVDAFAKPEERILPTELETDEEMARRILEELEKE